MNMKPMNMPLRVSREVINAYELRTGFKGIGEFFKNEGLFEIVEENGCRTV